MSTISHPVKQLLYSIDRDSRSTLKKNDKYSVAINTFIIEQYLTIYLINSEVHI